MTAPRIPGPKAEQTPRGGCSGATAVVVLVPRAFCGVIGATALCWLAFQKLFGKKFLSARREWRLHVDVSLLVFK